MLVRCDDCGALVQSRQRQEKPYKRFLRWEDSAARGFCGRHDAYIGVSNVQALSQDARREAFNFSSQSLTL